MADLLHYHLLQRLDPRLRRLFQRPHTGEGEGGVLVEDFVLLDSQVFSSTFGAALPVSTQQSTWAFLNFQCRPTFRPGTLFSSIHR
jgi:hypothetical protein